MHLTNVFKLYLHNVMFEILKLWRSIIAKVTRSTFYYSNKEDKTMLYLSMGTKSFSYHIALGAPFLMMPLFAAQCQQNEGTSGWLQKEGTDTSQHWGEEVDMVQSHNYQQLSSSKNSYGTVKSVVASVLFFTVLCRRGSTEMEEASRINKPVWKKKKD